jgi:hypothetical protein
MATTSTKTLLSVSAVLKPYFISILVFCIFSRNAPEKLISFQPPQ